MSSAAVVIGALRVKFLVYAGITLHFILPKISFPPFHWQSNIVDVTAERGRRGLRGGVCVSLLLSNNCLQMAYYKCHWYDYNASFSFRSFSFFIFIFFIIKYSRTENLSTVVT